jgi:RNA polymerase sigma-70 factor (ECF subfamily)
VKSDAELIAASLGHPETFGEIFDRHAEPLLRFFVRRVGPAEAGGLVGDVFRIAFERRSAFDGGHSNARPWLYGIGSNLLRTRRRTEARGLRAAPMFLAGTESQRADDGLVNARLVLPKLVDAIDALPEGDRAALLLFALEELGYAEIAIALEIPVGTVRSRISRARRKLRELIPEEGGR